MTTLLQQAIAAIEQLPLAEQDAIARRLLADLEDDRAWEEQFQATTNDQWDQLTASVRRSLVTGEIRPLQDLFLQDDTKA